MRTLFPLAPLVCMTLLGSVAAYGTEAAESQAGSNSFWTVSWTHTSLNPIAGVMPYRLDMNLCEISPSGAADCVSMTPGLLKTRVFPAGREGEVSTIIGVNFESQEIVEAIQAAGFKNISRLAFHLVIERETRRGAYRLPANKSRLHFKVPLVKFLRKKRGQVSVRTSHEIFEDEVGGKSENFLKVQYTIVP